MQLTPNYLYFSCPKRGPSVKLVLELKYIILVEEESGGLLKSSKLVLHLTVTSDNGNITIHHLTIIICLIGSTYLVNF